ncbi:Bug family tripartite tricarboxylate transporter substrate binding protein [Xylophilus ampelinus]|uniref:Tripartite-type tricarboxylate transporter receptor subunit TctC n=1 Tax=Xylophilus ampelinus TaxID=54067 RepID=A0A318SQ31_9BURK|nr:tripartite tricarboxylate transporter substrate binding protein [Xylophilus ampelinus]MCS4509390.1 tripartite tricarboxylate transporter substrate binding protein [Xylophilus ampelinus]PYE79112.1 tripartite-type tricarboxylate transporter receptor subunit TctC [Xylophilus ampelinus]
MQRRTFVHSAPAAALVAAFPAAFAQDNWPTKPVTYLVPFPAGGTTDILARLIGQKLGAALNTTFVVDNRAGAGGSIGSELGARTPADGYTIVGGTVSSHAINVSIYPKLGYDPVKSFTPIVLIGANPVVLVVGEKSPYKTLKDVIAAAKAKPGTVTSASAGNGTSQHMALELLGFQSGTKFVHVPYKGSGPAIQDVIAGQVDMMFDTTVVAGPHIQSGKLRALAVSSAKRLDSMPDVPTVAETVPGFEVLSWQGIFAPANTPKPIVDKLNAEILKILATPEIQDRLKSLGMQSNPMTPAQFGEFQKKEVDKWAQVVKAAGIKLE